MEGLIFAVVIFIISSVLSKDKKKDKPTKQMPPFSPQQVPPVQPQADTSPAQSLEDFANEVFGQLRHKKEVVAPAVEVVEDIIQPEVVEKKVVSTRPKLGETRPIIQRTKQATFNPIPKTQQQLMQAIITSEILAPPKAKQRK